MNITLWIAASAVALAFIASPRFKAGSTAAGLALLMTGVVIVRLRRREMRKIAAPTTLAVVAAAIAVLRFGPYAF